jgi:phosphatidyl-myo-inositol dimannoside synthase
MKLNRLLQVQMLLTDGYGGFGGISRFNRDFLSALSVCPSVARVHALPRLIGEEIGEIIPEGVVYDRKCATGKFNFASRVIHGALRRGPTDLVICGHLNLLPVAWLVARVTGARLALIIHGIEAWAPSHHVFSNRLVGGVDSFISVSRYSAKCFTEWSKLAASQGFILPNCVDLDRFKPGPRDAELVERYGLGANKVILTVGRLASEERYKGFDEVIDVMPRLLERFPALRYLIVGDGPDRPRLQAKVERSGLSGHVIFAGQIAEREKVAHYNLADAYVMPSMGEGFGIVLIEAAACGIPVVGSCADGSRDALLDGRLGCMIDPKRPEELIEAIGAAIGGEARRARNSLVETFGVPEFQARVCNWVSEQAALIGRANSAPIVELGAARAEARTNS